MEEDLAKQIEEALNKIDFIQKDTSLFDNPKVHERLADLLGLLSSKTHELGRLFEKQGPEMQKMLQDLFFNMTKMKELINDLKERPQNFEFQQGFLEALNHVKEELSRLKRN